MNRRSKSLGKKVLVVDNTGDADFSRALIRHGISLRPVEDQEGNNRAALLPGKIRGSSTKGGSSKMIGFARPRNPSLGADWTGEDCSKMERSSGGPSQILTPFLSAFLSPTYTCRPDQRGETGERFARLHEGMLKQKSVCCSAMGVLDSALRVGDHEHSLSFLVPP
jgi:hypothetical protein